MRRILISTYRQAIAVSLTLIYDLFLVSQAEAVYRYAKGLKKKYITGFKYSENPKDASILDGKRMEIEQRIQEIDRRTEKLQKLEAKVNEIECTPEDLDPKINSDAKWMELCASTISKSERLINTLAD